MTIIDQILSWPIIIQGALGSGLFWLFIFFSQKIMRLLSDRFKGVIGNHQNEIKARDKLLMQALRSEQPDDRISIWTLGIWMALNYIIKAAIFYLLGVSLSKSIPAFSIAGSIGSLVYMLLALRACPSLSKYYKQHNTEMKNANVQRINDFETDR